jgi:hypothetical protein
MKLLRVFLVVALLAVPLIASDALADFTAGWYDVPFHRISATTDNQPIIGFTIPCAGGGKQSPDTLKTLALKSFIERSFSVGYIKLWVESNHTAGFQETDTHLKTVSLGTTAFQTQDTLLFSNINYMIRECVAGIDEDTFYVTVDANTDSVDARAYFYHEHGLEVVIEPGYIHLGLSSGEVNTNRVANGGYNAAAPPQPAYFDYFKLVFDTQGPPISMLWCFAVDGCKSDTVDQLDSLCIRADTTAFAGPGDALSGNITADLRAFGLSSSFALKKGSYGGSSCFSASPAGWDSCFLIPDLKGNTYCIDVDSGHVIYFTAHDSAGNTTVAPLYFDKPIDTCKPKIDSVQFFITYDQNGDGIAAIGDSLAIVAWGLSNADFEVDSMIANLSSYFPSQPSKRWQKLDDVLNNNRLFRKKFMLEEEPVEMTADSSENRLTIWAWDNACNYDTLEKKLNKRVDLQRPSFVDCYYYWHWDIDTFDCIGIGDSVLIGADLSGNNDLASVTCDLVEAGIYGAQNQSLFDDGTVPHGDATADDGIFNLLWQVGEPPIEDGKDVNNTVPPTADADYSVKFTATDSAGNWDTCRAVLNRTLDTRRPRWTNQTKMYIKQMPDAKLAIFWPTSQTTPANSCNEKDAVFFYVYVDSGSGYGATPIGATFNTEYKADTNMWISEMLTDGQYYRFKVKQEDDCGNYSDFSKEMGAVADGTPPHVCIAVPDSGLTFGDDFLVKAVADSVSHDVDSVCLWYRFRRDLTDPLLPPGPWERCRRNPCCCMISPGDAWVWIDTMSCISNYTGWVELITVACDVAGNCQDTTMGFDDACLVMGDDTFRPGHFLFYWDTLAPGVMVTEVNGFPSPQTSCGYDVAPGDTNWLVIDVDGAEMGELFEVEVRALGTSTDNRIFHQDTCAMPFSIPFFVDGWPEGTQNLYIYVTDYDNGETGNAQVQVCVPPAAPENCVYLSWPREWMRIPCTGTSGYNCVELEADVHDYAQCSGVTFTDGIFQWSPTGSDPWYMIEDVIGSGPWTTCWDNTGLVEDGDTVYFRVIGHDEHGPAGADTSHMVKVFMDCQQPNVSLRIEDLYYTCGDETPKVPCAPLTLKAVLGDTLVDIDHVVFFVKRHSDPDIWDYWHRINDADPAWSDNIWMYYWEHPCCREVAKPMSACMEPGDYWDIRIAARDISGNYMFDYDQDGNFDDSTFNDCLAANAGLTVFVDDQAPQPAISMVRDEGTGITIVNPSELLGGTDDAYVQAGNDITVEVSVLPSEDTCEVMKVEWFLSIREHDHFGGYHDRDYVHVGTSTTGNHYQITFNPVTLGLIPPEMLEDGHWVGHLKAELYDSLGNNQDDRIDLYILDVTPTQAVIIEPLNDCYVWGDVTLKVAAINDYQICKVCYEYRAAEDEVWYPVNGGYPNACISEEEQHGGPGGGAADDHHHRNFELTWHTLNTLNTVPDGEYYLRAVATDCDNNVDQDPHTIKVTVANGLPTAVIDDPGTCDRTCPDNPEDTLGYVSGTVTLSASASSVIPIDHVTFLYKDRFDDADDWEEIDTDYFPTDGKYTVLWDTPNFEDKHHHKVSDGRYYLKARAYTAADRYGDSEPVEVSIDNSAPFAAITAVMGQPIPPDGVDITLGDIIDIELVAIDSTSPFGWTECYNSGLAGIEVCIQECYVGDKTEGGDVYTKCFEVSPATDGFHTVQWNTSGLEFEGCEGCYEFYVKAWDCLGNVITTDPVTVYVSDVTAPVTTIGGFDGNYIYGYSSESVYSLLFEYADSGSADWIPIGYSTVVDDDCHLYKTSWNPSNLDDGTYQVRVISHDTCSNQDDDMAPIAYIHMYNGSLTPYSPNGLMGPMSFLKNWCVGGMHGVVLQTVQTGTPMMIARYMSSYGSYDYECVDMQAHLQNSDDFAGSFYASALEDGGTGEFFSSVTMQVSPPPMTGVDKVTYLSSGTFDIAKVKSDLGTHGTYQNGCVDLTIQGGSVDEDEYVWVAPTEMPWAPLDQPDILPIGDLHHYATYISFTECYYCCGFGSAYFGGDQGQAAGAGSADGYHRCCLNDGKYAIIKMCYDSTTTVDAEHLKVAWWDCDEGKYRFDHIAHSVFNTTDHTVEFDVDCLRGPFVVIQLLERQCEGTISVNMLEMKPYCNGYTNSMPTFKALITDNVQGTEGIDRSSIQFKTDLYNPGQLIRIYNGAEYEYCDKWMPGFGSFQGSGYDEVSGIFTAGWSDSTYGVYLEDYTDSWCEGCVRRYFYSDYWNWICMPAQGLASGDHMATVTGMNKNIQTCTDTVEFMVDATKPKMWFADSAGAYVGKNPQLCIYFTDAQAGVDKSSIWLDIFGASTRYTTPDPSSHYYDATVGPDQLDWINDTTVCVDLTYQFNQGGYVHVFVYGGPTWKCNANCPNTQYYGYTGGVADCVGNRLSAFWRYYTVDATKPKIALVECGDPLGLQITDTLSGVAAVYVYEDGILQSEAITQDATNPEYWWYSPASGAKKAEIKVVDNVGNVADTIFSLPVDCAGPTVKFGDQYVCKNPTIELWITDPAGVDWTSVNVYMSGCGESCYFLADDLGDYIDTETGKITLSGCNLECTDGNSIGVYVYSGTNTTGDGPKDLNGNHGKYRYCSFVVDATAPSISATSLSERPVVFTITDAKSGVDWNSFEFYEDGVLICDGTECSDEAVQVNTETGKVTYDPASGGGKVEIRVNDMTGCNLADKTYDIGYMANDPLVFGDPHNYPNPFDPRAEKTTIVTGLSKDAYLTVKIYDFAGEFVKELQKDVWTQASKPLSWDGKTDSGTDVATGTYLCYLHARDESGSTKIAVIKITVVKVDK